VRGLPALVLPPGVHGPGAAALVRPEAQDMFGLGAREAVLGALKGADPRGFGAPCTAVELVAHLTALVAGAELRLEEDEVAVLRVAGTEREQGAAEARLEAAAFALGWHPPAEGRGRHRTHGRQRAVLRFRAGTP
jgi:coenzyme F420-0:L-glutamate ligase/coenzyme F420-1:gamma-L-glutamate ligase